MATPAAIGPYQVVRELGRGGMGVVLEVRHPSAERRLALKLISQEGVDAVVLERFQREAQLLSRVSHPGVVRVHAFERDRGRPYIVTDLIEGRNLKSVAAEAPLEPLRAARIVAAVCAGVAAIHEKGILHRDLKPENVILQPGDAPVLLDFGLAREHDARSLTMTGALLGTPAYMAPEQAAGAKGATLDGRTDVYGLGAILFELLAGRAPFDTQGDVQKIVAVLMKEPTWPSATRKDVPRDLEALLKKAMAKKPEERFLSAEAFGAALLRFAGGEKNEIAARGPGARRVVAAVAALIVALGVGVALLRGREGGPVPPPGNPEIAHPGSDTATPGSATATARYPDPPQGRDDSPSGFRALVAWLAKDGARAHRSHEDVQRRVKKTQDLKGLWAIEVPAAEDPSNPGQIRVRFISDRWLAVCPNSSSKHVLLLDLESPRPSLRTVWTIPTSRAYDVALGQPAAGSRRAFIAGWGGLFEGSFAATDDPAAPPPGAAALTARSGTAGMVWSRVALSHDGRLLAFGGDQGNLRIDDLSGSAAPLESPVPGKRCRFLTFVPGSSQVLVGTASDTESKSWISLYDAGNPKPLGEPTALGGDLFGMAVSRRDPTVVAVANAYEFCSLRRVADRSVLTSVEVDELKGARIALGGRSEPVLYAVNRALPTVVSVWKMSAPAVQVRERERGEGQPDSVDLSPDGALLAIGGPLNGKRCVEVWAAGD